MIVLHVLVMAKVSQIQETKEFQHSCFDPSSSTVQKNSNDPPPLTNIQGTRRIKGYFFYENLRPNQQLDVHAM